MAQAGYPLAKEGKDIGQPYQGSHGTSAPRNWESRNAVDIAVPEGTPVLAAADGVIGSQIGPISGADQSGRFGGQRVHVIANGQEFYYAHLSKITVQPGQHVKEGDVIGYTGKANGVEHLHFAVKNGDPNDYLGAAPTAGTQPAGTTTTAAPADTTAATTPAAPPELPAPPPPSGILGLAGPPTLEPPGMAAIGDYVHPQTVSTNLWQQVANSALPSPEAQRYASG